MNESAAAQPDQRNFQNKFKEMQRNAKQINRHDF